MIVSFEAGIGFRGSEYDRAGCEGGGAGVCVCVCVGGGGGECDYD